MSKNATSRTFKDTEGVGNDLSYRENKYVLRVDLIFGYVGTGLSGPQETEQGRVELKNKE